MGTGGNASLHRGPTKWAPDWLEVATGTGYLATGGSFIGLSTWWFAQNLKRLHTLATTGPEYTYEKHIEFLQHFGLFALSGLGVVIVLGVCSFGMVLMWDGLATRRPLTPKENAEELSKK